MKKLARKRLTGKFLFALLAFLLIIWVSFISKSYALFFILFLMYLDKTLLSLFEICWYFGIELLTIPIICTGILYGPFFGFIMGFIIDKLFDVVRVVVAPPVTRKVVPLIPTPGSFILGVTGALAAIFAYNLPFVDAVIYLTIVKNVLFIFKEILMKGTPYVSANALNILFNYFFALLLVKVGIIKFLGI